ncbi:MAG: TraR/DksA family transcriptional regulator [Propionibacteriaceae bacterium]
MAEPRPNLAALLNERVDQTRAQQAALMTAIDDMRETRSLTVADDEHDPEGSTVSLDQARDAALLIRIERTLTELVTAQERLASGGHGICERCGREIPTERLLARPEARHCVPCSTSPRK